MASKPFSCLPYVDNCCFCVPDLRMAVYLISIYSMVDGFVAIIRILIPPCANMRGGSFGSFIYAYEVFVCIAGFFVFLSALLMLLTTIMNYPVLTPFIVCTFVEAILDFFLPILFLTKMIMLKFECALPFFVTNGQRVTKTAPIHDLFFLIVIITTILEGTVMIYYTFVVNTFGRMWENLDGDNPEPALDNADIQIVRNRSAPAVL